MGNISEGAAVHLMFEEDFGIDSDIGLGFEVGMMNHVRK